MLIETSTRTINHPPAHLLIHAEGQPANDGGHLESMRSWLRTIYRREQVLEWNPLRLRIEDIQGNCLLASDDLGALIDVSLPAGTYLVTAYFGRHRRCYTLKLAEGTSFDLYLRPPPKQQQLSTRLLDP